MPRLEPEVEKRGEGGAVAVHGLVRQQRGKASHGSAAQPELRRRGEAQGAPAGGGAAGAAHALQQREGHHGRKHCIAVSRGRCQQRWGTRRKSPLSATRWARAPALPACMGHAEQVCPPAVASVREAGSACSISRGPSHLHARNGQPGRIRCGPPSVVTTANGGGQAVNPAVWLLRKGCPAPCWPPAARLACPAAGSARSVG